MHRSHFAVSSSSDWLRSASLGPDRGNTSSPEPSRAERSPIGRWSLGRWSLWVTLCVLLFATLGCDGLGGDDDDGGDTPMDPGPAIVLLPDTSDGPRVTLRAGASSFENRLTLEVVAEDVTDLAGGVFGFSFPNDLFAFRGSSNGGFFGLPVTTVTSVGNDLFVSILSPLGLGADGTGVILRFEFDAVTSGEGRFEFVAPEAFDSNQVEIEDIRWLGADVIVDL